VAYSVSSAPGLPRRRPPTGAHTGLGNSHPQYGRGTLGPNSDDATSAPVSSSVTNRLSASVNIDRCERSQRAKAPSSPTVIDNHVRAYVEDVTDTYCFAWW